MKKVFILVILVVVAVAAVGAYIMFMSKQVSDSTEQASDIQVNETKVAGDANGEFSGIGTLAALQARGENVECTLTYKPSELEAEVSGSYFFAAGKVRGDFIVPAPELGGSVVTSMITDGNTTYVWSDIDGQLYGTKTVTDEVNTTDTTSAGAPVPEDVNVTYTCKPWQTVDNSVFEPPANVLFQDTAELMKAGMEYGTIFEEGEMMPN